MEERRPKQKLNKQGTLSWLYQVAGRGKWEILLLIVLCSLQSAISVIFALAMKAVVDAAVLGDRKDFFFKLFLLGLLMVLQLLLAAMIRREEERSKSKLENKFKGRLYQGILTRDYASLSKIHSGELLNRLTGDVLVVANQITEILPAVISMVVKLVGAAGVLLVLDLRFALIFLLGGILMLLVTYAFRKVMKRLHKEVQEADGKARSYLQETIQNILVIRSFGKENQIVAEANEKLEEHKQVRMKRNAFYVLCNAGLSLVMKGGYFLGVIWGGYGILTRSLTYGTLTAVLSLVGQIQAPFANISGYLPRFYSMIASAERLREVEDLPEDAGLHRKSQEECKKLYEDLSSIEIKDLQFTYPEGVMAIKDKSFSIKKGDFIAITGKSGIGKSTLLKLLLGVYQPDFGSLTLVLKDGKSQALSARDRGLFSYVPQGNFLLSGTITEGITYGQASNVDEERLEQALRLSCATDFVNDLPEGRNSTLGEGGRGLSEGQTQRIALARAIYSKAPILLLDESTSALDAETEKKVLENLKEQTDQTVLIVTHRKAALEVCDQVLHF